MNLPKWEYVMIPKGTVLQISNPDFDENDHRTHKNVEVVLEHDMVFQNVDDVMVSIK